MDLPGIRRIKYQFASNKQIAVALLVLIAVVIGVGAAMQSLEYTKQQVVESSQEVKILQNSSGTANESIAPYTEGETVQSSVYQTQTFKQINVTVRVDGAVNGSVEVDSYVRYSAVSSASDIEKPFWNAQEKLEQNRIEGGKQKAASVVTVDVLDTRQRVTQLQRNFGSQTTITTGVVTDVQYRAEGKLHETQLVTPITFTEQTVVVDTQSVVETHETTKTVRKPLERKTIRIGGIPRPIGQVVGGVASILLFVFAGAMWLTVRELDPKEIKLDIETYRFRDWISGIERPINQFRYPSQYSVSSIDDLVDIAIDTRSRVLYDKQTRLFCVTDDDSLYVYEGASALEYTPELFRGEIDIEIDESGLLASPPPDSPEENDTDSREDNGEFGMGDIES